MDTKYKLFLFISFCFSLTVCCKEKISTNYSAEHITANFSGNGEIKNVLLEENVKIVYKEITIKCKKAYMDMITGDVKAEGDVEAEYKFGKFFAQECQYNLNNESGILKKVKFSIPPIYGEVEKIEKKGNLFLLEDGYFTTCDKQPPHYRFICKKIEYCENEYIRAEKMKIVFGDNFTVFYFPKFSQKLKPKEPSIFPSLGFRSRLGTTISTIFNQYISEENDLTLSERIDLNKKGFGFGLGLSSEEKQEQYVNLDGLYFKEWGDTAFKKGIIGEYQKSQENKYGTLNFILNWRWMEDYQFFYDYFHKEFYNKSKNYNYFSVSQEFPEGILDLLVRENAGEEFLNIEKLPELRFFSPYIPISESIPLYLKSNFQLTHYLKDDKEYVRGIENLIFESKKNIGFFNVKPFLSFSSATYYENSEGEKQNFPAEIGVEFSTFLKKDYNPNTTGYFSPSISFLVRRTDYKPSQLPYFDTTELFDTGKYVKLDLNWDFLKENEYIGKVNFTNFYDINRKEFADTFFKYEVSLSKSFKIIGENIWNFTDEDYIFGVNDFVFEKDKFKYLVGPRYMKNEVWGLENWIEQKIGKNWKYRFGIYYDFREDGNVVQNYEIWRTIHCWDIDFKITKDENDTSFYIVFIPTAFKEIDTWKERFLKWK